MATSQQEVKAPAQVNENPAFVAIQQKMPPAPPTNSTNKSILDHLLYRSIQSRLKQAQLESLEMASSLTSQDKTPLQEQKKHWLDMVSLAEQDKKAVESVVKGILTNHRSKRPSFQVDDHFEQRLHLCQLTNLIFGRRDAGQFDANEDTSSASNKRRRRHHHHQHHYHHHHQQHQHLHQHHQRHHSSPSEQVSLGTSTAKDVNDENDTKICRWTHMIAPPHCRRHRFQHCDLCSDLSTTAPVSASSFPPGLLEAIPTFMKTSADLLRRTLETNNHDDDDNHDKKKPMIFAGQKVMGGGMPPRWYDLFLELLTQAAIECYLCDMQTGLESIYEIFSYGDVEDEDEPERHTDDDDEESDSEDMHHHHQSSTSNLSADDNEADQTETEIVGDNNDDDDDWSVEAADHHLLFPKTRTMYLFKTQVREREKEILVIEENVSLHQHFQALAKRYPLDNFEKNMGEYIQMMHHTMATPDLDNKDDDHHDGTVTTANIDKKVTTDNGNGPAATSSKTTPSIYKYPCDGSLLMPELPEEEDATDDATIIQQQQQEEQSTVNNKRRASVDLEKPEDTKKHG